MASVSRVGWTGSLLLIAGVGCGDDGRREDSTAGGSGVAMSTGEMGGTGAETAADGGTSSRPPTSSGPSASTRGTVGDDTGVTEPGGGGTIEVELDGCEVDFGGTVVVSNDDALGVASVYEGGGRLSGSFQFDLEGPGTIALSSQHRVDTGTVINMVGLDQGTWTNLDDNGLGGGPDSIGGTLVVETWEPEQGRADIEFQGVTLLNVASGNVCTIDGSVVTTALYP